MLHRFGFNDAMSAVFHSNTLRRDFRCAKGIILGVSYLFFLICERPFLVKRRGEPMAETEREAALSPAP